MRHRPTHALLLVPLALLLAACGSDRAPVTATTVPPPLVGSQDPILSTHADPRPDPVSATLSPVRARPPQFGTDHDEASTSAATPIDPCLLVPRRDVRRIAGPISARHLGKQGPTCVYSLRSAPGRILTVAVQSGPLPAAVGQRSTIRLHVRGRPAYCVRRTPVTVLVPVARRTWLAVAAPCPIAARLAGVALTRLPR